VRHGEDQVVWLTTEATSEIVAIRWRVEGGAWVANALQPSQSENVYYHTFTDIQTPIAYQIRAAGSQSAVYHIDVWTPPEVAWIDAVYTYPAYTGLPAKAVSAISTIEAPTGTSIDLTVHANQPVNAGELTFSFGQPLTLSSDGPNTLIGLIEVGADDTFHVALTTESGHHNIDDRPYAITARWDEVAEIRIQFPRGDDEATPIEEIPFAFTIKDDFGIWQYGIQYEIAGREPVRRVLGERSRSERSIESSDLLMLEHLDLEPGDFVTWYVWAEDGNPSRTDYDQMSDPFFLEIRPFARTYSEAVSNAGQQGGGQGQSVSDQKQVIIATWNLRKSAADLVEPEYGERRDAIVTAQREVLAAALESANMAPESFAVIQRVRTSADEAVAALSASTWQEPGEKLSEALRHEQVVHQLLLSLVPTESTIGQGRPGSGGGGGGGGQANRNLDALELTRRTDFSEEASTQNERLSQTEAVRKGIEDLAKRQTFINQDVAELTSELEQAEEERKDELERRLQRLIDEQRRNLSELDALNGEVAAGDMDRDQTRETRKGLSEAGRQMRQTLRNLEENRIQRARSSGSNALRELSDVEDQLGSLSQKAAAERLGELAESMDQLEERQNEILEGVRQKQDRTPGLRSLDSPTHDPLLDQKEALSRSFENFMNEAGELAEASGARQGLASQKLNDWLRETSRDGIHEDMEQGKRAILSGVWDVSERQENRVLTKLRDARKRLDAVTDALVANELDGMRQALEQVKQLVPDEAGAPSLSTPDGLSGFLEGDYRNWVEGIRAAESLLSDGDVRRELSGVREDIDRVRRRFRRDKVPPRFDLVYDRITRPLQQAAKSLEQEIARESGEYAVGIERFDTVPERYREQVADYFKALSEIDVTEDR